MTLSESVQRHVIAYLTACLAEAGGNISRAAIVAGMHRSNFYRLCNRFGVSAEPARAAKADKGATARLFTVWQPVHPTKLARGVRV